MIPKENPEDSKEESIFDPELKVSLFGRIYIFKFKIQNRGSS